MAPEQRARDLDYDIYRVHAVVRHSRKPSNFDAAQEDKEKRYGTRAGDIYWDLHEQHHADCDCPRDLVETSVIHVSSNADLLSCQSPELARFRAVLDGTSREADAAFGASPRRPSFVLLLFQHDGLCTNPVFLKAFLETYAALNIILFYFESESRYTQIRAKTLVDAINQYHITGTALGDDSTGLAKDLLQRIIAAGSNKIDMSEAMQRQKVNGIHQRNSMKLDYARLNEAASRPIQDVHICEAELRSGSTIELHELPTVHHHFFCPIVGCFFHDSEAPTVVEHAYEEHVHRSEGEKAGRCPLCTLSTIHVVAGTLYRHFVKHFDLKLRCDVALCGFTFRSLYELDLHKARKHLAVSLAFSCHVQGCSRSFEKQQMLDYHHESSHLHTTWLCPRCGEAVRDFRRHWDNECSTRPVMYRFKCPACPRIFWTRSSLSSHFRTQHIRYDAFRAFCLGKGSKDQLLNDVEVSMERESDDLYETTMIDEYLISQDALSPEITAPDCIDDLHEEGCDRIWPIRRHLDSTMSPPADRIVHTFRMPNQDDAFMTSVPQPYTPRERELRAVLESFTTQYRDFTGGHELVARMRAIPATTIPSTFDWAFAVDAVSPGLQLTVISVVQGKVILTPPDETRDHSPRLYVFAEDSPFVPDRPHFSGLRVIQAVDFYLYVDVATSKICRTRLTHTGTMELNISNDEDDDAKLSGTDIAPAPCKNNGSLYVHQWQSRRTFAADPLSSLVVPPPTYSPGPSRESKRVRHNARPTDEQIRTITKVIYSKPGDTWTLSEDCHLIRLKEQRKLKWVDIVKQFPNATYDGVRQHYHRYLRTGKDIKKPKITQKSGLS